MVSVYALNKPIIKQSQIPGKWKENRSQEEWEREREREREMQFRVEILFQIESSAEFNISYKKDLFQGLPWVYFDKCFM